MCLILARAWDQEITYMNACGIDSDAAFAVLKKAIAVFGNIGTMVSFDRGSHKAGATGLERYALDLMLRKGADVCGFPHVDSTTREPTVVVPGPGETQ